MVDFAALFADIQEALQILSYATVILAVAPLFPFLYVVMKWRAPGQGHVGIGTLGAVHYFQVLSALILLAGAANLSYGWVSTTPVDPVTTRYSWGMFVGSGLFFLLNLGLQRLTRDLSDLPDVRRMFTGFFLVMTGLTSFAVLLLFFVAWFQEVDAKDENAVAERIDAMKLYAAWLLYFLTAYLASTLWMTRSAPRS
ncbi:MAG: hypothetical protein AAGD14_01840 [Planctomycetota bacterium]